MITVAVCTYNRALSLRRTLDSMSKLRADGVAVWELLVIDNNSTDDTPAVVRTAMDDLPIRYVHESVQGLSAARNRALSEAKGDVVVFTDDDVTVDAGWIGAYSDAFRCWPEADYFGGRVIPQYESGRPGWLNDEGLAFISGILCNYDLGDRMREYEATDPSPIGASFALRRRLFSEALKFRLDLGPVRGSRGRGDDTFYFQEARRLGHKGVYVPDAVCFHWTPQQRLALRALYEYGRESGLAFARMNKSTIGSLKAIGRSASYLVRGAHQLCRGRGDRFRQCVINIGVVKGLWEASVGEGAKLARGAGGKEQTQSR